MLAAYGARLVEADWEAAPGRPGQSSRRRRPHRGGDARAPGAPRSSRTPPTRTRTTRAPVRRSGGRRPGSVTHFVASIGTGGTVSGAGRFLKDVSAGEVRVIGANPVGSTYGGGAPGRIIVDGVGTAWPREFWPDDLRPTILDEVRTIDDREVYATIRRLATEEALLLGPSSGLAVAVALQVAREARSRVRRRGDRARRRRQLPDQGLRPRSGWPTPASRTDPQPPQHA